MVEDPVIQHIRGIRQQISQEQEHDPRKLVEYYRQRQQGHPERLWQREAAVASASEAGQGA